MLNCGICSICLTFLIQDHLSCCSTLLCSCFTFFWSWNNQKCFNAIIGQKGITVTSMARFNLERSFEVVISRTRNVNSAKNETKKVEKSQTSLNKGTTYSPWNSSRFQFIRNGHIIGPNVKLPLTQSKYSTQNRSRMNSNPHGQLNWGSLAFDKVDGFDHMLTKFNTTIGMIVSGHR